MKPCGYCFVRTIIQREILTRLSDARFASPRKGGRRQLPPNYPPPPGPLNRLMISACFVWAVDTPPQHMKLGFGGSRRPLPAGSEAGVVLPPAPRTIRRGKRPTSARLLYTHLGTQVYIICRAGVPCFGPRVGGPAGHI